MRPKAEFHFEGEDGGSGGSITFITTIMHLSELERLGVKFKVSIPNYKER